MPHHAADHRTRIVRTTFPLLPQIEQLDPRRLLAAGPVLLGGVGVLGDSNADEYQFYPPERATARNFVEQLAEDRALVFGNFTFAPRPEPRLEGYAFNYARSGATSTDMLAQGQHTELADWAAGSAISYAFIFAGGNDIRNVLAAPNAAAALPAAAATAAGNITTAVSTLLAAKPDLKIVIATLPSAGIVPQVQAAVESGQVPQALVDAADAAIASLNNQIRILGDSSRQIAVADIEGLEDRIFSKRQFRVGGIKIYRETPSDVPTHLFLSDGHPGTVAHGLIANRFIKALRSEFGDRVRPLSNREILLNAGLSRRSHVVQPAIDPTPSPDTPFFPTTSPPSSPFSTTSILLNSKQEDVLD